MRWRASRVVVWCFSRCAGIRGLLLLSLASARRYRASRVAPVRGGTYFSLPPQRKVGKRKRLTPPILDVCPRAPNVPTLHTPVALVGARCQRFEQSPHPLHAPVQRPAAANDTGRPGGKLCVGRRAV